MSSNDISAQIAIEFGSIAETLKEIETIIQRADSGNLLQMFCDNREEESSLPRLLDETLFVKLTSLRKFRHVVFHGYSTKFEWEPLRGSLCTIAEIVQAFEKRADEALTISRRR